MYWTGLVPCYDAKHRKKVHSIPKWPYKAGEFELASSSMLINLNKLQNVVAFSSIKMPANSSRHGLITKPGNAHNQDGNCIPIGMLLKISKIGKSHNLKA